MSFFNASSWDADTLAHTKLARCGTCGLARNCRSPRMQPTGQGKKRILFIAEAPGKDEDRQGIQLVGDAGKLIRKIIHSIGEELDEATKTNCVICRPPKNAIQDIYIDSCRPNIIKTIKEIQPTVIVLLGRSSLASILPLEWKDSIGPLERWVGWTIPSRAYKAWLCPTYHPSYLARMDKDPILMRLLKQHLKEAYRLERQGPPRVPPLRSLERKVEIILKPSQARARMRDLSKKKGILAFDYETTGLKPDRLEQRIVSCSFCLDGQDTFACLIDDKAMRALSKVLLNENLRKVASNLKFEERWTRAKLGHGVAGWYWDTMLAAHVLDNRRGICSVKFQAYILLGIGDYSSKIKHLFYSKAANGLNQIETAPVPDLLLYNGLDSLLEYRVMEKQTARFPRL